MSNVMVNLIDSSNERFSVNDALSNNVGFTFKGIHYQVTQKGYFCSNCNSHFAQLLEDTLHECHKHEQPIQSKPTNYCVLKVIVIRGTNEAKFVSSGNSEFDGILKKIVYTRYPSVEVIPKSQGNEGYWLKKSYGTAGNVKYQSYSSGLNKI